MRRLIVIVVVILQMSCTRAKQNADEKYRVLTNEDGLVCEFSQYVSANVGAGLGGTMHVDANSFQCGRPNRRYKADIELESVGLGNGKVAIRTKKFGTVYRANEPGKFGTYEMTDSQIKELKTLLPE